MRRLLILGSLAVALVIFLPFSGFLTARNATTTTTTACSANDGISQPITGPIPTVPGLTSAQAQLAKIIWIEAHRLQDQLHGPADQAAVIGIAVASQESTLGANPAIARPNADGDAGPFQQRQLPGWYGTLAQVTSPTYATTTFFIGHTVTAAQAGQAAVAGTRPAGAAGYHITGLADVRDWPSHDIIDAADQVQRSAFPDAVADDIPLARQLVAKFDTGEGKSASRLMIAGSSSTTCGSTPTPHRAAQVVAIGKAVTPVGHYTITATFGEVGSWARYHTGLDFAAPIGTPVRAALAGTVTHAGFGGAAGSWAGDYVTIKHSDGTSTLYAHMSAIFVVSGQTVSTADRIGSIGVTGRSFGPHLHFETYPKGVQPGDIYRATDPVKWLERRDVDRRLSPAGR